MKILTILGNKLFEWAHEDDDRTVSGSSNPKPLVQHTEGQRRATFNAWCRYHRVYNGLWRAKTV